MSRKKGRRISLMLALVMLLGTFAFGADVSMAKITDANTPVGVGNAHLKWERQFGTGYANAVTPPLVLGDHIYIGSAGTVYKLDKSTGAIKDSCALDGVFGYTTIAPAHNGTLPDGSDATCIYVPISDGRIGAIDISGGSMKLADGWTNGASESFGGQSIAPVVSHGGYLYTGAWTGRKSEEAQYEKTDYFAEIDSSTGEIVTRLSNSENGGFYWTGAYVTDGYAVFGEDSIGGEGAGTSTVRCVATSGNTDCAAGTVLSSQTVEGSVRSSMTFKGEAGEGHLYFVSKAGKLYKMPIEADGTLGTPQNVTLSGQSVGVPQVTDTRAYVGTSAAKVDVIDISSMTVKYSVSVPGYPQGEMLVRQKDSSTDYIYGAYNKKPGGIFFIEAGTSSAKSSGILYDPVHPNNSISPVECDEAGTLYFKNDSGYVMAVEGGYDLTAPVLKKTSVSAASTKLAWNATAGASAYEIYRATKSAGPYAKLGTVTAASYIDKKTLPKKTYYYKVRAKVGSEYTTYSNVVSAKSTLAKPKIATKAGKRKIKITWKKITGASGYKIYQATKKKGKYKLVKTIKSQKTVKYIKTKLKKNKKYYYKVKAYRKVGGKTALSGFSNISYKRAK